MSCVPIALVRNDLKQYTADAFFALALFAITRFVEGDSKPRAVVWLGAAALVAVPFSTSSALVSVACFTGLFVMAIAPRRRDRAVATLMVGGVVALGFVVVFATTVWPHVTKSLTKLLVRLLPHRWASPHARSVVDAVGPAFDVARDPGVGVDALFVVGIVALVRLHTTAVAITVPFL